MAKKKPVINKIVAKKLNVRVNSNDKYLPDLLSKLEEKPFSEIPNIKLKEYSITYNNFRNGDKYNLKGQNFESRKLINYKNFQVKAQGDFSINDKKHIGYDVAVLPRFELQGSVDNAKIDFESFISQIKELDFHTDVIADLKIKKNADGETQTNGLINIDNMSVLDYGHRNPKSFIYVTFLGDKASVLSNIYAQGENKVYIEGYVNTSDKPIVDLKVKTDDIDLNTMYKKLKILTNFSKFKGIDSLNGGLNANFTLKGDLNKIKSNGYMKVTNASVKASGLKIDKINSDIDFSGNSINIVNATGYVDKSPIFAKGVISKDSFIYVGVVFSGKFTICRFDFGLCCLTFYAKCFVIIFIFHNRTSPYTSILI